MEKIALEVGYHGRIARRPTQHRLQGEVCQLRLRKSGVHHFEHHANPSPV